MTHLSHRTLRGRRFGLVAIAGLSLCLTACNRESPTALAVRKAQNQIRALTPAGAQPVSVDHRQKVYAEIKKDLGGTLTSGTPSEIAAAAVLLSQSQVGLAQISAAEAADLSGASLHDQIKARAVLGRWLTHSAIADAAAKYDPSKALAALDADTQNLDRALAAAQKSKAQIDAQVQDLRAQSQARIAQARELQKQAGVLRAKIPNETAVNGSELLKQAREIGRRADAFEVEGANLEAQAAKVAPQSAEAQIDIDKVTAQKALVAQGKQSVQKRAGDAKAQEQQARADAAQVAKDLADLFQGLATRQDEIKTKTDVALAGFDAAAKSAKKGANELRATGQMALGSALQNSGDASWNLAQSYATLADACDSVVGAPLNPPGAPELKAKSDESRAAAKAALEAATASYQSAFEAYDKAGGKADAAGVMEKLKQGLSLNAKKTSGGALDLMPPPEKPPEAEKPADTGAAAAIEPGSPQATIQSLIDYSKAEQFDQVADLFAYDSPEQKQAMKSLFSIAPKFKALEKAIKDKFGTDLKDMAGAMGGGMGGMQGSPIANADSMKVSDLKFEVTGDTATARGAGGQDLTLKKVDGKWLIELGAAGVPAEQMAMMSAMIPALGKAADDTVEEIKAGKYPDAQAAIQAFTQKMMKGMGMPGMPKGGPGGGG